MRLVKASLLMLLGIIIVVITIGGIIAVAFFSSGSYSRETRSQWPVVQSTILSFEAREDVGNDTPINVRFSSKDWFVQVSFTYEVSGVRYFGYQQWYESKAEAEKEKVYYLPGSVIDVHFNSDKPYIAVVEPTKIAFAWIDWWWVYLLSGLLFLGVGIGAILTSLDRFKTRNRSRYRYTS
jgi:hypothetical protein